jgi:GT2 family glycosyltransferase
MGEGVGVVVLSYNRKDDLLLALKSIYASDYRNISVVVVDNNSSDGSADAVAENYPDTPLIRNPENLGVSRGSNLGWRFANEHFDVKYITFIDDDAEVANDYFTKMVGVFREHPEVGLVLAKAYIAKDSDILCSVGMSINLYTGIIHDIGAGRRDKGKYNFPAYRDACPGFVFSVRNTLFHQLGGFDEHYSPYGWEDADFSIRARSVGDKAYYAPDMIVFHKGTKIGRGPNALYPVGSG